MKTIVKYAAAVAIAGALAATAITPSEARNGRNTAAAIGLGAGVLIGAAAANANNGAYYGPGYYGPNYGGPAYYGEPVYYGRSPAYYGPGPYARERVYVEPTDVYYAQEPAYGYGRGGCWVPTDDSKGVGYYGSCRSPGARAVK